MASHTAAVGLAAEAGEGLAVVAGGGGGLGVRGAPGWSSRSRTARAANRSPGAKSASASPAACLMAASSAAARAAAPRPSRRIGWFSPQRPPRARAGSYRARAASGLPSRCRSIARTVSSSCWRTSAGARRSVVAEARRHQRVASSVRVGSREMIRARATAARTVIVGRSWAAERHTACSSSVIASLARPRSARRRPRSRRLRAWSGWSSSRLRASRVAAASSKRPRSIMTAGGVEALGGLRVGALGRGRAAAVLDGRERQWGSPGALQGVGVGGLEAGDEGGRGGPCCGRGRRGWRRGSRRRR